MGAVIRLHDNGPGIPDVYRETIFDKYTKFSISNSTNASAGIGLTIATEITHLLGGTITAANSRKYSGAVFTL